MYWTKYAIFSLKMKKKTIVLASAVVLLVLVVGIFLSLKKNKTQQPAPKGTSEEQSVTSTETATVKQSIKDLIAAGISQKCSLEYTDGEMKTSSETWIKGGKFMQIMAVSAPESGKRVVNTISDGNYLYSWEDGASTGHKIKIEEKSNTEEVNQETVDVQMDDLFDYKCAPALIDDSQFTLPATVEFKDLNEELKKLQEQFQQLPNQ